MPCDNNWSLIRNELVTCRKSDGVDALLFPKADALRTHVYDSSSSGDETWRFRSSSFCACLTFRWACSLTYHVGEYVKTLGENTLSKTHRQTLIPEIQVERSLLLWWTPQWPAKYPGWWGKEGGNRAWRQPNLSLPNAFSFLMKQADFTWPHMKGQEVCPCASNTIGSQQATANDNVFHVVFVSS